MANAENLKKGKATQFKSGKDAVENGRKGRCGLRGIPTTKEGHASGCGHAAEYADPP